MGLLGERLSLVCALTSRCKFDSCPVHIHGLEKPNARRIDADGACRLVHSGTCRDGATSVFESPMMHLSGSFQIRLLFYAAAAGSGVAFDGIKVFWA